MIYRHDNWKNTRRIRKLSRKNSCSSNIRGGLSAYKTCYKPLKLVVYCLNKMQIGPRARSDGSKTHVLSEYKTQKAFFGYRN